MCGVTEAIIAAVGIASAGLNYAQSEADASYQRTKAKDTADANKQSAQRAIEDKNRADTLSLLSQSRSLENLAEDRLEAERNSMQKKATAYASKYADGMATDVIDKERRRNAARTIESFNAAGKKIDTDYELERLGTAEKTAAKIASLNDVYTQDKSTYNALHFASKIGSTGANMLKKETK